MGSGLLAGSGKPIDQNDYPRFVLIGLLLASFARRDSSRRPSKGEQQ
jgi:hypothetical protein